ncbi:DUF2891 family protein [uncultured Methylobacterium sp.]|jgi:Ca2+-binding RTX toxin-like protein|uniref:DUF2891 family protein n=1 Tax=uncultured Methylobacterium sp. TaxID=157278 RepID=UPI002629AABE|nr:DUF2891 family protein [uncultured Methylobacterium sp.]
MATVRIDPKDFYLDGSVDAEAVAKNAANAETYLGVTSAPYESGPIFSGSYDWHSSVHSNLAVISAFEAAGDESGLADYVERTFTPEGVQGEIDRNQDDPYGWAWLLKLDQNLKDHGFNNLDAAAKHFADELVAAAKDMEDNPLFFMFFPRYGLHYDQRWWLSSVYDWGIKNGRQDLADQAKTMFMSSESSQPINDASKLDYGSDRGYFWSNLGLSAYSHVLMDITDTDIYKTTYDRMLASASIGDLDKLIANTTTDVTSGNTGFSHYPGILLTTAYGYWALFEKTGGISFSRAYGEIIDFARTYAPELGANIGTGHWLPSFATFAATLPMTMPARELKGVMANGTAGADLYVGDITNDTLTGGLGDDDLIGGANDDTLSGGDGNDVLYGDAGVLPSGAIGMGVSVQTLTKDGGNTTPATALDLNNHFSLYNDPNIARSTANPHTTVNATGNGDFSFYTIHLDAGETLIIDIDGADKGTGVTGSFDSYVQLLDAGGNIIAENNDAPIDAGSTGTGDAGLTAAISTTGNYIIKVGSGQTSGIPTDATYTLNVSIEATNAILIHQYAGDAGSDLLDGGAGSDTVDGGGGNDTVLGGGDNDLLYGRDGTDSVLGGEANDFGSGG